MNYLEEGIKLIFNTNNYYLISVIESIIIFILFYLFLKIISLINNKIISNDKILYFTKKINKTTLSLIYIVIFVYIWRDTFKDIITIISFISAAMTLAIREIIYNYFCGLYIKISRPIKIEDRIKINDVIGDVVNINILSFEILEVLEDTNQSTGKIIHVPSSKIFSATVTDYNTAFKYIWDELSIEININNDIEVAKNIFLDIVSSNDVVKAIPTKMKKEIKNANADYRIYYNKLTPIIYTKVVEDKVVLTARFLVHPKKQRNVESDIYESLLIEYKKNNIKFSSEE